MTSMLDISVEPYEIVGTEAADILTGSTSADVIRALGGSDIIDARDGSDTIYAGGDADIVEGGRGDDLIYGGSGDDVLAGESGADILYGEAGSDTLEGGSGEDMLYGGGGEDTISGGDKADILTGGAGADTLTGGKGDDVFHFQTVADLGDSITDFKSGKDALTFDANEFNADFDAETGQLDAQAFESVREFDLSEPATTATFVFDQATDNLYYDQVGDGEGYTLVANINDGEVDLGDILLID